MRLFHSTDTPVRCQEESGNRAGLTKLEVVALLVCAVGLLAIAIPQILASRGRARLATCAVRQFRTALAIQAFDQEFQRLPGWRQFQANDAKGIKQPGTWGFQILPFLTPIGNSVILEGATGNREVEGLEPFALRPDERLKPRPTTFLGLVENYGPGGPAETRGKPIDAQVNEFLCPAAWIEANRSGTTRSAMLSWQVNTGLPDHLSEVAPPDWPATALFLDRFDPSGPMTFSRLSEVEQWDGINHTVMFAEGLGAGAWNQPDEASVGFVFGWPQAAEETAERSASDSANEASQSLPNTPFPSDARWSWSGLGTPQKPSQESSSANPWRRPTSRHVEGINVTFANGATQVFDPNIDPWVWARLVMPYDEQARYPGSNVSINDRPWPEQ